MTDSHGKQIAVLTSTHVAYGVGRKSTCELLPYFTPLSHCPPIYIYISSESPVFLTFLKKKNKLLGGIAAYLIGLLHSPLVQQVAVCRTSAVTSSNKEGGTGQ